MIFLYSPTSGVYITGYGKILAYNEDQSCSFINTADISELEYHKAQSVYMQHCLHFFFIYILTDLSPLSGPVQGNYKD